jgi:LDH2 family malate/lactate/ureidoglycolate dehydrogenase
MVGAALKNLGYNEEERRVITDVLMYAQLRGNNQGIVKLIGGGMSKDPDAGPIAVRRETKLSSLLDGNRNHGMVVLTRAVEIARAKAQEHGFGLVGTCNTSTSTGALGYYVSRIASHGLVGLVLAGSPPRVCPHGSFEPLFGTNPLGIGVSGENGSIVFDMATSAIAYYGLVEAATAGSRIPPDVAYDDQGVLTDDPAAALNGAVLPFDRSYKGSGLSLFVEILTGPLVGASFVGLGNAFGNWGNLVLAFDPGLLVDRDAFSRDVTQLGNRVKEADKLPGVAEVLLPGERGDRLAKRRMDEGLIEVEDNLYRELEKIVTP